MSNYLKKFTSKATFVGDRENFLIEYCRNKRVVHIGCTDWPLTEDQIESGNLLHPKLIEVVNEIMGVDTDEFGIEILSSRYPNSPFSSGDFISDPHIMDSIVSFQPDLILVPDVIEHVEDAGAFLQGLRMILTLCQGNGTTAPQLLMTTPNAYSLKTFLPIFLNRDVTHPDHCALHNEVTLEHLLTHADLSIVDFYYSSRDISKRYGFAPQVISKPLDLLSKLLPRIADTIVVKAKHATS